MASRPVFLGIDLGTTNSAAAVFDGEVVSVVRNPAGTALTPSVVRIDGRGRVSVGHLARKRLERDPDNTSTGFKRLMGTDGAIAFPAAGVERTPEELSAEVLRSVRANATDQLGFAPARAVLSVPALFELPQAAATRRAAELAGFDEVQLIQEPVASALAAGWADDSDGVWLVFDLGGGTFDASLVEGAEGFLRVVGHDGDNFLGGRDMDRALADLALARLHAAGVALDRANPEQAAALRALDLASEDAKIALSREDEVVLDLGGPLLELDGVDDADLVVTRAQAEAVFAPIVDRALAVCRRLIKAEGVESLARVVLVGGPTAAPVVRRRVGEVLGAPIAQGHDPMLLVARGAALYAASHGLEACAEEPPEQAPAGRPLWLQHPAVSADLKPCVVGRVLDGPAASPARVRLVRREPAWEGPWAEVDPDGTFVVDAALEPRRRCVFQLEARAADGEPVVVHPAEFAIVHGVTLGDPPLSRSVGVALASDRVEVYFQRGAPLPARRTVTLRTVESVAAGSSACALRIPIVQGELEAAHLCRLVGALELRGEALSATVPAGSAVEVTLQLDRGGQLTARALVPATGQVFEEVARMLVPAASADVLDGLVQDASDRLASLRADASRRRDRAALAGLADLEDLLRGAAASAVAARGGDDDAAQRARRTLLDVEAELDWRDLQRAWPELEAEAADACAWAASWVGSYGSASEKALFDDALAAVAQARASHEVDELQRQLRRVRHLGHAAFSRHPEAWAMRFRSVAGRAQEASDAAAAQRLVRDGQRAIEGGDEAGVRAAVEGLWRMLPVDARDRDKGHRSGVR